MKDLPAPLHVKNNIMNGISQCLNIFKLHSSAEIQNFTEVSLNYSSDSSLLHGIIRDVNKDRVLAERERQTSSAAVTLKQQPTFRAILKYSSTAKARNSDLYIFSDLHFWLLLPQGSKELV